MFFLFAGGVSSKGEKVVINESRVDRKSVQIDGGPEREREKYVSAPPYRRVPIDRLIVD